MGRDPAFNTLIPRGFHISIVAGSQNSHEDLSLPNLTRLRVCDGHGLSGIIDKQLLSRFVLLSQIDLKVLLPMIVMVIKLASLVAIRVYIFIFLPKQLHRDTFLFQLLMNPLPIWS